MPQTQTVNPAQLLEQMEEKLEEFQDLLKALAEDSRAADVADWIATDLQPLKATVRASQQAYKRIYS